MANDNDADPFERYFRPRPDGAGAGGAAPAAADDTGEGVTVDGVPAPRVVVETPRGPRRPGPGLSPRAAVSARRQRRFLMLTGAVSAFVLVTSGGAWAFQSYVTGAIDKVKVGGLGRGKDGPKGAMTILVAGVDRREGLTRAQQKAARLGNEPGERSDTMLLMHVSRNHDQISVVSLPRDSFVTIPAHKSNGSEGATGTRIPARQGKLTWAYQFGGPDLTVATIKQATGVAIDHYIEVNFYGFVNMVNALGGVDVCVEQPVYDKKSGLRLNAGTSHVDGLKALAFTRARYTLTGGSDLGRIDRQQLFMAQMMKQALSSKTLSDPIKSGKFLNAALKSLRVDEKLAKNLPALADQMKDLSTDKVEFGKVPLESDNYMTPINGSAPQSTVLWDQHQAGDLFSRIRRDEPFVKPTPKKSATPAKKDKNAPTVPPGDIQVLVRNGVGTLGLAGDAGSDLRKAGFAATVVPGVARRGLRTTTIQYGPGREEAAKTLAAAIPGAKVKRLGSLGSRVQVIVGADWNGVKKVKVASAGNTAAPTTTPRDGDMEVATASQKLCK